jgi:hypothetical protein
MNGECSEQRRPASKPGRLFADAPSFLGFVTDTRYSSRTAGSSAIQSYRSGASNDHLSRFRGSSPSRDRDTFYVP